MGICFIALFCGVEKRHVNLLGRRGNLKITLVMSGLKVIRREEVKQDHLPGRIIQEVIGKGAFCSSERVTAGFGHYSEASGPMEPHQHAEEVFHILSAKDSWVRFGPSRDRLDTRVTLKAGMTLHIPELEWHVFEFKPGGHVDAIFFYGQVDNIRPEEISKQRE